MKKHALFFIITILLLLFAFTSCENVQRLIEWTQGVGATEETEHVHAYGDWIVVSEATCKDSGKKVRVCACGHNEIETIDTISHKYVNNVCSVCNQSKSSQFVPDYAAGQANVVGSDNCFSNYTSQANYLYFDADGYKISKMKTDRTGFETVYQVTAGKVRNVNVVGDWIYFYCVGNTVGKSYIARVRTDGSGFEKIVSSINVENMLVAKDTVYYTIIPDDGKYYDFEKDVMALYAVSVNGGTPTQIHDGAVSNMVADSTYVYFIYSVKSGNDKICRIKHGSTSSATLFTAKDIWLLSLENSKLYFLLQDPYSDASSLASVSTNGSGYTTYGKVENYLDRLHVVGNKVYYMGSLYIENGVCEEVGLVEFDLTTKKSRIVREDYDLNGFEFASELLIFENYDREKLESITIYYSKSNSFNNVKIS